MITPQPPRHRDDIDGLRAIAILGVLAFHLNKALLPGGFLGVDVFFVISGFLITSILRREITGGRFSFSRFYERRIRRIAPAFFVVTLLTFIAACFVMLPAELLAFAKSFRAALLSFGNVHFLRTTQDYFNDQADVEALLHTWSLGVEEQFYLILPLALIGLHKLRNVTGALIALFVVSLAGCVIYGYIDPAKTFFLLHFRAWQMLLGSLLAYQVFPELKPRAAAPVGILGLILIVGSMVFMDGGTFNLGLAALPATIGAALLLLAGTQASSPANRFLASKPLVGLGLISYSVYLWHWPLIALTRACYGEVSSPILASLGAASLLLGWASWKWIETPFRRPEFLSRRAIFVLWIVITLLLLGATIAVKETRGLAFRYSPEVRAMLAWKTQRASFPNDVKKHWDTARAPVVGDIAKTPTIALWGDSHADALLPWLDEAARKHGVSVRVFTVAAQVPVPGIVVDKNYNAERLRYTDAVLREITRDPALKTVVLHARWAYSLYGYNEEPGTQTLRFYGHTDLDLPGREKFYADRIKAVVGHLLSAGKTVALVYPVPEVGESVPDLLAHRLAKEKPLPSEIPLPDFAQRERVVLAALDGVPDNPKLLRIRLDQRLLHDGKLTIQVNGRPLYFDDDHLSSAGLDYVSDLLEPIVSGAR